MSKALCTKSKGAIDGTRATASGENGVLTIKTPKKKKAGTKVIKVKTK